jgi:hypothetical protein
MVVQIVQEQAASIAFAVFIVLIPLYVVETQMRELNGFNYSSILHATVFKTLATMQTHCVQKLYN